MNHYKDMLKEVGSLIESGKRDEALKIIQEELAMPYIPKDVGEILHSYLEELITKEATALSQLTVEQVVEGLNANEPMERISIISNLKNSNIRNYIDEIKEYLNGEDDNMLKNTMLDILIDQGVNEEVTVRYDFGQKTFVPAKTPKIMSNERLDVYYTVLEDLLAGFDVSLLQTTKQLLDILILEGYPREEIKEFYAICAGLSLKANAMLGNPHKNEKINHLFGLTDEQSERALAFIDTILTK